MNNSHQLAPWADAVFAMDRAWWNEYGHGVAPGPELWTSNREAARIFGLHHVHGEPGGGISGKANIIRMGGNSGFQALSLALLFGAARVVLLGYDMQRTGGASHWHGDHPRLGNPVGKKMRGWRDAFAQLAADTTVPIVNASRATALACFPREPLSACLS